MPCGACRQTLSEFGDDDVLILYPDEDGRDKSTTLGALLPHAFRIQFLDPK
jgi:cytidine deaminase